MIKNDIEIRLNFFPLVKQDFEYSLWRKEYSQGEKRNEEFRDYYRNTLPVQNDINQRKDYWVSFSEPTIYGFEKYNCKPHYNHKLTQYLLFHLLKNRSKYCIDKDKFVIDGIYRKKINYILQTHPQGKEAVWLEPYYLNSENKFGYLADYKFIKNRDVPFTREIQKLSLSLDGNYRSNRNFYQDKYDKIKYFLKTYKGKIFPIISEEIGVSIDIMDSFQKVKDTFSLKTKEYVFGNNNISNSQFKGLQTYGPLDKIQKTVQLVFIFQSRDKYLIDDLIEGLQGKSSYILFDGLKKFFDLNVNSYEKKEMDDFSDESLNDIVTYLQETLKNPGINRILPIFVIDKDIEEDTYYKIKNVLLNEEIPSQFVTRQLLKNRDSLNWSVSNIAVAIFSKLGGKPWKVKPSNEKCIILGIGQSHLIRNGNVQKYFAYSVCTDSSGLYEKINVLGRSNSRENYLSQLKERLIETIKEFSNKNYDKFVLHVPFKIKKYEIERIYEAIQEQSNIDSDHRFVILRVNQENKFFGYANTNSLVPYESAVLPLSSNEYLIWFEGLQYHRTKIIKRIPGPVYVQFYWANHDLDITEKKSYLQDAINISGANWRGFNAKNLPISIYYCQLISKFLSKFPEEIEDVENIQNPWFL